MPIDPDYEIAAHIIFDFNHPDALFDQRVAVGNIAVSLERLAISSTSELIARYIGPMDLARQVAELLPEATSRSPDPRVAGGLGTPADVANAARATGSEAPSGAPRRRYLQFDLELVDRYPEFGDGRWRVRFHCLLLLATDFPAFRLSDANWTPELEPVLAEVDWKVPEARRGRLVYALTDFAVGSTAAYGADRVVESLVSRLAREDARKSVGTRPPTTMFLGLTGLERLMAHFDESIPFWEGHPSALDAAASPELARRVVKMVLDDRPHLQTMMMFASGLENVVANAGAVFPYGFIRDFRCANWDIALENPVIEMLPERGARDAIIGEHDRSEVLPKDCALPFLTAALNLAVNFQDSWSSHVVLDTEVAPDRRFGVL